MLEIFTWFADWLAYSVLGLLPNTKLGGGVHFFIEDVSKILVLLLVLIYAIGFIRASLNLDKVRAYLQGKNKAVGYVLGSMFGAITPFCSCSSIPLFMGFVSVRIPIGVAMAFLVTSPLINEIVVIMLASVLGIKFTLIYIAAGMVLGIVAGIVLDLLQAQRWLVPFLANAYKQEQVQANMPVAAKNSIKLTAAERHQFAKDETIKIFSKIWLWVIIGVGAGACIHNFVPTNWFAENFAQGQWWTVPAATISGIPLYTNAAGIVPVMSSLIEKGLPLGTSLAFCMSAVAVSLPEIIMLKQVMQYKFLAILLAYLLVAISLIGWLFNFYYI